MATIPTMETPTPIPAWAATGRARPPSPDPPAAGLSLGALPAVGSKSGCFGVADVGLAEEVESVVESSVESVDDNVVDVDEVVDELLGTDELLGSGSSVMLK